MILGCWDQGSTSLALQGSRTCTCTRTQNVMGSSCVVLLCLSVVLCGLALSF